MQLQATCCHCWVPGWVERDDQLWGSGRGAIGGCHRRSCRVPLWVLWEGVTTNFEGVDMLPLLGAIVVCYVWGVGC